MTATGNSLPSPHRISGVTDNDFIAFVAARGPALRRTAYLLTGDWHSAEDVVQSALVKLYVAWPRVRRRGEEAAYARKVVLRTFLDHRRKPWRREQSTAELPDVQQLGDVGAPIGDRLTILAALAKLPHGMRAVVVCRFWEDLSVEETSYLLHVSTGTVKSQTAKALARLRSDLLAPTSGELT